MLQVQKTLDLPVHELAEILAESKMAGFRMIDRLINDWMTGVNRFDYPGEALFTAWQNDRIVGICGLNCDPYSDLSKTARVRHLYVMQDNRRQGVGRRLVHQVIQTAVLNFERLHVRTTDVIAAQFYQSLGFAPCNNEFVTHVLHLSSTHLSPADQDREQQ